ncbi:MAG: [Protein-PII] uridylyltransferase / [Protein-PII]-UMP uridylyl-removing enzyme, partial [uncultured Friedmanniella sp.]
GDQLLGLVAVEGAPGRGAGRPGRRPAGQRPDARTGAGAHRTAGHRPGTGHPRADRAGDRGRRGRARRPAGDLRGPRPAGAVQPVRRGAGAQPARRPGRPGERRGCPRHARLCRPAALRAAAGARDPRRQRARRARGHTAARRPAASARARLQPGRGPGRTAPRLLVRRRGDRDGEPRGGPRPGPGRPAVPADRGPGRRRAQRQLGDGRDLGWRRGGRLLRLRPIRRPDRLRAAGPRGAGAAGRRRRRGTRPGGVGQGRHAGL